MNRPRGAAPTTEVHSAPYPVASPRRLRRICTPNSLMWPTTMDNGDGPMSDWTWASVECRGAEPGEDLIVLLVDLVR